MLLRNCNNGTTLGTYHVASPQKPPALLPDHDRLLTMLTICARDVPTCGGSMLRPPTVLVLLSCRGLRARQVAYCGLRAGMWLFAD